jgi:hypothetical protein
MLYRPRIAILGHGRAGKDESGLWLGTHSWLRYVGSTSMVICPMIAAERGVTPAYAWQRRHAERKFWYDWANEYRKDDPAKIAKECLKQGDLVIGLRDKHELQACKDQNLFDLIVWIRRDVPNDPTVTFGPEDCDVVLYNDKGKEELYARWTRLMRLAGVQINLYEAYQKPKLPDWAYLPSLPISENEEPFGSTNIVVA